MYTLTNSGQDVFKLNVNTNTIDNYCKENQIDPIDYIKKHVEGAKKLVLQGAINYKIVTYIQNNYLFHL